MSDYDACTICHTDDSAYSLTDSLSDKTTDIRAFERSDAEARTNSYEVAESTPVDAANPVANDCSPVVVPNPFADAPTNSLAVGVANRGVGARTFFLAFVADRERVDDDAIYANTSIDRGADSIPWGSFSPSDTAPQPASAHGAANDTLPQDPADFVSVDNSTDGAYCATFERAIITTDDILATNFNTKAGLLHWSRRRVLLRAWSYRSRMAGSIRGRWYVFE